MRERSSRPQEQGAHKESNKTAMREILGSYLRLHPYVNNWDLVDLSAYKIIGQHEPLTGDYALMDYWIMPARRGRNNAHAHGPTFCDFRHFPAKRFCDFRHFPAKRFCDFRHIG